MAWGCLKRWACMKSMCCMTMRKSAGWIVVFVFMHPLLRCSGHVKAAFSAGSCEARMLQGKPGELQAGGGEGRRGPCERGAGWVRYLWLTSPPLQPSAAGASW